MTDDLRWHWPPLLEPGDTVAAVAPSGLSSLERMERGQALLESWGLQVEVAPSAFVGHHSGFLAADDAMRVADLNAALAAERYAGVFCIRGGYGSQRLLDQLDVRPLVTEPKVFVGFSDVTALHVAIGQRAGLVTFHGPNLQWNPDRLDECSARSLRTAVMGGTPEVLRGQPLGGGRVRAPMVGGNLTLLSTLCGTPDSLEASGTVLLCEDVGEDPYRVDRALTHLRRAGVLDGVVGLVFDEFHNCVAKQGMSAACDVAAEHAAALGVPSVFGVPLGHGQQQRTVALGASVVVDGDAGTVAPETGGAAT